MNMIISSHAKKTQGFGTPEILCSFYYVSTAELVIFTREDHLSFGKKMYC